jgi:hypothetical protein
MAFQFPALIERYEQELDLSSEEAAQLFVGVKQFLYICGFEREKGPWSPPEKIDAGWHEFILFTRQYHEFCIEMFGRFIHHTPYSSSTPEEVRGNSQKTREMAEALFGPLNLNEEHWGPSIKVGCSACGGPCNDCGD